MPLLYLVRHGESEANRLSIFSNRDLPHALADLGRAQVEELAGRLQDVAFTAIYASPILSARETAQILADRLHLPFELAPALAEFDMGILEGTFASEGWYRQKTLFESWRNGDTHARASCWSDMVARSSACFHPYSPT
ncbi:MAG: histidine phosphatase family protein [Chloroflexi bacterium]|nr:histidine phosphatase family protein [Chloroflexota bacterium]MBV9132223.1 histidine phosphatase family protein [Chloroflexota bacterium]MBV9893929.1 histidine phosphatase family protein [Chloroflexota bacterium]